MALKLRFWGTRGSLPRPTPNEEQSHIIRSLLVDFAESGGTVDAVDHFLESQSKTRVGGFGGETTCVQVESPKTSLLIDGGSGIRSAGLSLLSGPCGKGKGEVHIFMTHFHWDHLIGLPFFTPLYIPGNEIHFYSPESHLEKALHTLFQRPFFPVEYERLGAKISFHKIPRREAISIGDIDVTPYLLDHPDPCWGYRFESGGKAAAYCVDTECRRVTPQELGADYPLYRGADLMVIDAQYMLGEAADRINWGHAVATLGLDLALREGIERVVFTHHDPSASYEKIKVALEQTRSYHDTARNYALKESQEIPAVEWEFAYDGLVVTI